MLDQPGASQFSESGRDSGTPHAEHRGKEFVRHRYDVRAHAVARHQQPAGTALLDQVESVAGGGLRGEVQDGFGEAQHDPAHRRALIECRLTQRGVHAQRGYRTLHDELAIRYHPSEQSGHPTIPSVPIMPTSTVEPFDIFIRMEASPCSIK